MKVYFLSEEPAALKLDGQYAGTIDLFERFAEIDAARGAFAEILPHSDGEAHNFFICESFFKKPLPFAQVYDLGEDKLIYIKEYPPKKTLDIIAQGKAGGVLVTVFRLGGIYAATEAGGAQLHALGGKFKSAEISAENIGGCEYAAVRGKGALALFRGENLVFFGEGESFEFGETLKLKRTLCTCTRAVTREEYAFGGDRFLSRAQKTEHGRAAGGSLIPFAFFESVLYGGCEEYLCDGLKEKAGLLKDYLGKFSAVLPPCESAEKKYGKSAAGLVYGGENGVFTVKYFIAETDGGKVTNIFPAEQKGAL